MSHLRLVARLDVKAPNLVKGVRLEGLRVVGSPSEHAARYALEGADEIHYQDIVAPLYGRSSIEPLVSETASEVFIPLMVGGGLRLLQENADQPRAASHLPLLTEQDHSLRVGGFGQERAVAVTVSC